MSGSTRPPARPERRFPTTGIPKGLHTAARAERKLAMPALAYGAETGVGAALINTMRLVASDVSGGVFEGCGHYMPEEAPRAVAEQVIRFMGA